MRKTIVYHNKEDAVHKSEISGLIILGLVILIMTIGNLQGVANVG